jgi:U3 small nucleolar RNA-associated protein 6
MAGVAEKARFYLERSVSQLREWEEKDIFSKEEIRTIVKKRNEFEHRVLSPGNTTNDWTSYAQWEVSLDTLRSKRCQRLNIRHMTSAHASQNRVITIYDRAVGRHPGQIELWREYLGYLAKVKAAKRWRKAMTNALRMMPTDPGLWVMAGRRSARTGDMAGARGFFMRGCRFCTKDSKLWIEYARCEMDWLYKLEKKKKAAKPGVDVLQAEKPRDDDELRLVDSDEDEDEEGGLLPEPSKAQAKVIDKQAAAQLQNNPALDGAIPMAIFDISRKQEYFQAEDAERFFVMVASFRELPVHSKISQHILSVMTEQYPNDPSTCNCHIRQPIIGVSPFTPDFPRSLRDVLQRLQDSLVTTTDRAALEQKTVAWMDEYLALEGLDEGIKTVLELTRSKLGTESS